MSNRKNSKHKHGVTCNTLSQQKSLEFELDQQNDTIQGLKHDIKELKASLANQTFLHQKALQNAEARARDHVMEMEALQAGHDKDLQDIGKAQVKQEESLKTLTRVCEDFENDNHKIHGLVKLQKKKINELKQLRTFDEDKIKTLSDCIRGIQDNESEMLEKLNLGCESYEKELKVLEERFNEINSEKTRSKVILGNIFGLISKSPLIDSQNSLGEIDAEKMMVDNQLSLLEGIIQQIMKNDDFKKKFQKSTSPRSHENFSSQMTPPKTILTPESRSIARKKLGHKQATDAQSLQSLTTNGSFDSGLSQRTKKSFLAPKTKAILKKMEESKGKDHIYSAHGLTQSYSFDSDTSSVGSVRKHDGDFYPTKSDIKSILHSNATSIEFDLIEVVNKALRAYYNVDQNIDNDEADMKPHQFISENEIVTRHIQEFGAQIKFWYSTLTVRGKSWDPSIPSIDFQFPGGLVGSRMGKIVYSSKEHAVDALLIFVLKSIDPSGVWMDDFFGEDEFSCILRKEGTLRNSHWLLLVRKRGKIFLSYVKDVTSLKTPIIMA